MKTIVHSFIKIVGDFDTYTIEQVNGRFITTSILGYSNECAVGHKSLIAAIKHVHSMIKTEYIDRGFETPKKRRI